MNGLEFFSKIYPATAELTIMDVGAHVGESVTSFATLFPKARIHAFEPASENYRRLCAALASRTGISTHPVAIGAVDGRTRLHLNNYDATHSILPINPEEINRWGDSADFVQTATVEVAQRTVDSFMTEHGLNSVDILKLDVQGGELLALQGARSNLAAHRIGCIFAEVEFRQLYSGQPLAWDIHGFLAKLGYQFINFSSPKLTDSGLMTWADAIYVCPLIWARLAQNHSAGRLH